ncbi:hypothetical protein [Bradyrhizobium prioriisuperbiae]|uniref:hypothetical protein n=1 Tax=Bradyrhizobium prioriisuperbiae TaxID=2854389 RepID=UPI0028E3E41D|nr:hypothetical protein [Bradyrhizobium prioritasuperba]
MIEASKSPHLARRQILLIAGALVLVAGGIAVLRGGGANSTTPAPAPAVAVTAAPRPQISDDLIEATRALGTTQQQAVDQLQVVQDLLANQRAETKRLSTEIEALNAKLSALQEAVANIPGAAGASAQQSKAPPAKTGR